MAKLTLLNMVQSILSDMDSDEVNSISDTVESLQVASIVKDSYADLVSTLEIPERQSLFQLESLGDVTRPNYLKIPDTIRRVEWIKYNGTEIQYLAQDAFVNHVLQNTDGTTVSDFNNIAYPILTDRDPTYFTSFNDTYVAFDSFNVNSESTLQQSNTICWGSLNYDFQMIDSFVPHLDDNMFPLLLSESKRAAFVNLKQVANSIEDQRARRSLTRVQNELSRTARGDPKDRLPDYSRRRS